MPSFVERDGVKLAYETSGQGKPAVILVHGWACDRSYFAPQYEHFATRRQVVSVDLRGHGDSDRPEPEPGVYDIDVLADDILAVADALGCARPIVIGHSLGGLVALAGAGRAGAVGAAVMVDSAPIMNASGKSRLGRAAESVAADDDGSWRRGFVSSMFLPTDTIRRSEIVSGMASQPTAIAAALVRSIVEFDGASALGAVEVPLLSIGSAVPSDIASDLRSVCPTITIGQTVGAGHFHQLEVPDQVNAMIDRFLAVNRL